MIVGGQPMDGRLLAIGLEAKIPTAMRLWYIKHTRNRAKATKKKNAGRCPARSVIIPAVMAVIIKAMFLI